MDGQLRFATLDYTGKKKRTKRDVFLTEMAAAVPWSVLEARRIIRRRVLKAAVERFRSP